MRKNRGTLKIFIAILLSNGLLSAVSAQGLSRMPSQMNVPHTAPQQTHISHVHYTTSQASQPPANAATRQSPTQRQNPGSARNGGANNNANVNPQLRVADTSVKAANRKQLQNIGKE